MTIYEAKGFQNSLVYPFDKIEPFEYIARIKPLVIPEGANIEVFKRNQAPYCLSGKVIPEKNGSYNINGQIRQPFMTEAFYYERAIYGYTPFTFKDRKGKNRNKVRKQTAYFIHDTYTKDGYNKPIFHLKFYAKYFVNALAVFEEKEAEDIVKQIMELDISDEVKDITLNTYECYLMDQEMRKKSGDAIPNIYQWIERSHDIGFNKKREKMLASGEVDEFLDNSELPEESEDEIFAKNNSFSINNLLETCPLFII